MTASDDPTPSSPRALVAAAGAEPRLDAARSWLLDHPGSVLVIAPARGAADDLARALGPRLGLHRRTPSQLAAELATPLLARDGLAPVSGLGLEALAARALALVAASDDDAEVDGEAEGGLEYFAPVADTPGMPRALARTLRELRSHGVAPDRLSTDASPRRRDLARLLRAFEELLDRGGLVDPPRLLALARDAIEDSQSSTTALLDRPTLLLDLAIDSPAEADFLRAVVARAPAAMATAVVGDTESLDRLSALLESPPTTLPDNARAPLGRLRRRIFRDDSDDTEEAAAPADDSGGLIFLSAPGEEREAVEIARRLQALAADGVPFDQCAVALRDPERYWPLLEEAFDRADIPVAFSRGTRRPDPAGRALLALLSCAIEHLSASRFAEYLSLGQLPATDAEGAPPRIEEVPWVAPEGDQLVFKSLLDVPTDELGTSSTEDDSPDDLDHVSVVAGSLRAPRQWERLLVDAAVIEGRDRWRRRLRGVLHELRLRQSTLEADDPRRRRLSADLRQLRALERFAVPLIDRLDDLPASATWGEWIEQLSQLASSAIVDPSRVLAVLGELRPMADVGPVGLEEVHRALEPRLSTLRTEPRGGRFGHVLVLSVEELRGRAFHTVFLPGLAEGRFPRRTPEDPLLGDADRHDLDAELPDRDRRVLRERRLLRLAIGAAHEQLVVSYPSLDTLEGRARVPSFYALDLLRAAEGRLPDLDQLSRRAAAAGSTRLGWPAPRDPSQAVDDAEFDLATLVRLAEQPSQGAARYLLEINPRLRRSLRNRYSRWASKISPADGMVLGADESTLDALRQLLLAERPTARTFSPTALQHFASCPYRFYLQALLRLRPRETPEPLEQMDALTRGGLFHETQFELLTQLAKSRLLPMRERDVETLYNLADQALDSVAGRFEEELAPAIPRVWASELEGLRIDLRGWIRSVVSAAEPWRPEHFELAFGLEPDAHHDPDSTREDAVIAGGRRLRGSIDMVEISTAEHPAGPGRIRVTDHKTGKALPTGRHVLVRGGETLQPLLYSLVAERLLSTSDSPRIVDGGRLAFCTRRGGYQTLDVRLDDEGRAAVDEVFSTVEKALAEGRLPAAPKEGACQWCDYRLVCGPREEARIHRKRPDQLADLDRLRRLP